MIDSMHLISLVGVGFALGSRHAFEPDHLVAVSTLATRPGGFRGALWLGTAWGFGHTMSLGAALLALIALDLHLPSSVSHLAELGVALLLVILGVATLRSLMKPSEASEETGEEEAEGKAPRTTSHSFGFGLIHGLAGSGTLLVLIAATAATAAEKLAFFVPFGVGTIGGMLFVSASTCGLTHLAGGNRPGWPRRLQIVAAWASITVGCWLGIETLGWLG
ncbi:MAG: HupE/UreJ family protein [Acidobacteriota bacterium]